MSIRFEMEKLQCTIKAKKEKLMVEFDDRFGLKYLEHIKPKELFCSGTFDKYKIRKKDNRLEFKLRDETLSGEMVREMHDRLKEQLTPYIDLHYYYFKSLPDNLHIKRNLRFVQISEKPYFRQIFPEIRCLILIQSEEKAASYLQDQKQQAQQNKFKKDELIIYIRSSKKQSLKHITKYMQTYTQERVIFGLDEYFNLAKFKHSGLLLQEMQTIIHRLILYLKQQIIHTGLSCQLFIKTLRPYVPATRKQRYKDNTDSFGLILDVEGMFQSLPQFYFSLMNIFKQHPITIGRVEDIHLLGNYHFTEQKYKQTHGVVMFFGSDSAIAVINLHQHYKEWLEFKRQLRKGYFLISQLNGFTKQQLDILIQQHREVQQFVNADVYSDFANYKFKPIDEKSFEIHCEHYVVGKFISRAFDYLKKNTKVQTKREEFLTQFEVQYFMKLARPHIEAKYHTVKFVVKGDGCLYSRSKQGDLKDLETEMKNQKRKMLKKIVRLPTVKPMKKCPKYQIIQDEFLAEEYCQQQLLRTLHYTFNQRIDIFIKPIQTINKCHTLLIPIIDRHFRHFPFFMSHFSTNNLSLDRYQKYATTTSDKANDRVITYSMGKSKYVNEMLVWYIETDERNAIHMKKMKWDIDDTVTKYKHQKNLQFVVPYHLWKNEYYFGNFFIELFRQFKRQEDYLKTQTITVYYETEPTSTTKIHQTTRKVFELANKDLFLLKARMFLGEQEIERIVLISHYSVRYWADNSNQSLSPLNSFVFNYEKSKKVHQEFKVPLFLKPVETIEYQYLLCLQQNAYYKIDKLCRIAKFPTQSCKPLARLAKVLKKYFSFSEYIVVYMNLQETEIQSKRLYFWLKPPNPQQTPQKVKRIEINQEEKLIQKKDSQVEVFVKRNDIVPKYVLETHEDFVTEVKRMILQQDE